MTLTVPVAGTSPGPAARAVPVEPGTGGAALAQLGQTLGEVGARLEADALDREFKRAQVDLTRDVNDLRLQVETIGHPDKANAAWKSGVETLRARYTTAEEGARPRISRKNTEPFRLAFDDLTNRVAFDLGRRTLGLRQSQREAMWLEYLQTAINAAAVADVDTRDQLIAQGDDQIAGLEASGVIDAAEAARRRIGLRRDVDNARAIRESFDDPAGFLRRAQDGEYGGLDADTLASYQVQAQRRQDAAEEKRAAEALREEERRGREIDQRLTGIRDILGDDREPVDLGFLNSPEARARPGYAETMAALQLRNEKGALATLTPDQIDALVAEEQARPLDAPWQAERLKLLESWQARHREGYATDPWGYRQQLGQAEPLPEFDPFDPGTFQAALAERQAEGRRLQAEGTTSGLRLLSDEERQALRAAAAPDRSPQERVTLALTLNGSLGRDGMDRVTGVIDDPVFGHVAGYLYQGGSPALASEVFRGQQALDAKTVQLPPRDKRTDAAFNIVQGYFAGIDGGESIERGVLDAADALYAARIKTQDPTGPIDNRAYRQAVHEVLGGTGTPGDREATGGLQEYRGEVTPLPRSVRVRDIENSVLRVRQMIGGHKFPANPKAIDAATDEAMYTGSVVRPIRWLTPEEARKKGEAVLTAASLTGGLPVVQGTLIDQSILKDATFRAVGNDRYQLVVDGLPIEDSATGGPYEFRLTTFLREAAR